MEKHVMKKFVFAASTLALAAGAHAAPFTALSYEAGGGLPGIVGQGFSVDFGGFFVAAGAGTNVLGGTSINFTPGNEQEFDSHFSFDPFGPAARNRTTGATNNSTMTLNFYGNYGPTSNTNTPGPGGSHEALDQIPGGVFIVGPGSHIGVPGGTENQARAGIAVSPPPVPSGFAPNATGGRSTLDGIFVGRFTIKANATLSGGMLFNTVDPSSGSGFFGANLTLGGPDVAFNTINGVQRLVLRAYQVGTIALENPSDATIDQDNEFGSAKVLDVWVHLLPTPGAVALFGMGGMAMLRRRRA